MMKKILFLSLFFSVLSSFGHFYLAKRSYELKAGEASSSAICNISKNINCDSALLSPYAEISGISLSNFGLGFNLILSLLLLFCLFFPVSPYWKTAILYLAGTIFVSSIAMAIISLLNHLFCPICWTLYLFSLLSFIGIFFVFKSDRIPFMEFNKQGWKEKGSWILGLSLGLVSLFFHASFVNLFDIKSQEKFTTALFFDWQMEDPVEIAPGYLLQKGPENSKMRVVEFADFLCPACKRVSPQLKSFLENFPDVHFQFYVYPLDGTCNPSLKFIQSGLSCEISKAVVCANQQKRGWPAHDFFFKNQAQFLKNQGKQDKIKALFKALLSESNMDSKQFESCMKQDSTLEKVRQSALIGEKAGINGTPNFFVNGKKTNPSAKLLIFRKIHQHLNK